MAGTFVLFGGLDKKISLEQQRHPCPKCKHQASVQLTRCETQLVVFNKTIGKPNNMRVRYECNECGWKNENLPDNPNMTQVPWNPSYESHSDSTASSGH
ncbi:hypothetical protein CLU79DRAFT_832409 [Phycomyces nitens]|nr:hypothetical protein CLU79DRAFT_832409 [Phycomyces nitens]